METVDFSWLILDKKRMQPRRNRALIYALLFAVWVLIVAWQVEEHARVRETAQTGLRKRSEAIANTLGAVVRGLQFRGAVFRDRLEPVLAELVASDTNGAASGEVVSITLLNAAGASVASAGRPVDLGQRDILQAGEHWGPRSMTRVYSVEGAFLNPEGDTNSQAPLILEPPTNSMHGGFRNFPRREPRSESTDASNLLSGAGTNLGSMNRDGPDRMPPPPPEDGSMQPSPDHPGPPHEGRTATTSSILGAQFGREAISGIDCEPRIARPCAHALHGIGPSRHQP